MNAAGTGVFPAQGAAEPAFRAGYEPEIYRNFTKRQGLFLAVTVRL
jgi:hypothetical protein